MDSLTHIALGACVGEAFFEKGFGKKAMFWGALSQSIPDIDFVASFWMTTPESLLAHRGFTHSLLFAFLAALALGLTAQKVHRPNNIALRTWIIFFSSEILLHLFIDGYNNYGIGWLEPFSHTRFSLNAIYVVDPFFSIWPFVAFVALLLLNRYSAARKFWWRTGMLIPFIYLCYCTVNKLVITAQVNKAMAAANIPHDRYFTTPAPLQNWLWWVVAGNDKGFYVGYRSLFDRQQEMTFTYFPKCDSLLLPIADHEDLQKLVRFSKGFYTVEKWGDTLVFNDLRFGQMMGWQAPKSRFVFHYFLQDPGGNELVTQRGRFAGWDKQAFLSLVKRIKGN